MTDRGLLWQSLHNISDPEQQERVVAEVDRHRIEGLARAVAERESVDWKIEFHDSHSDDERALVRQLEVVDAIAVSDSLLSEVEQLEDFEIVRAAGRGGMGVVYEARQRSLGRRVALKVMAPELTGDPVRLERFDREARLLATLNHSGIVTIYSVEHVAGLHVLNMEYVDGHPLNERMPNEGLPFEQVLDLGIQIADALSYAHENHVIHRDLKPSNLMLTRDGRVKILDFGLAKLRVVPGENAQSRASTLERAVTVDGTLLGTVPYMSPEQVEGKALDHRSDLFSLGVVLYELSTGRKPHHGESQAALISSILRESPASVTELNPALPGDFGRIVAHCLQKDPERRYQTAKGLRNELEELRRGESISAASRRFPGLKWWIAAAASIVVAVVAVRECSHPAMPTWTPSRVTHGPEWEYDPALSPDGRDVAFVSKRSGNEDIWIADTNGGQPMQRTRDPARDRSPAWFPDGGALAFVSNRAGRDDVWKADRFAGAPVLLIPDAVDPAVSPAGDRIAFARADASGVRRIYVAALDRPAEATVLTQADDGAEEHREPSWSPDGRELVYRGFYDLWVVPSTGGEARRLTTDRGWDRDPVYSPDGSFVYFQSWRENHISLWRVGSTGGPVERVTSGAGAETHPSISRDGKRLAHSTYIEEQEVVLLDLVTGERSPVMSLSAEWAPAFSPDLTRFVFCAGNSLWIQRLEDGRLAGEPVRLTDQSGPVALPAFSPDGHWIAYAHVLGKQRDIWITAVEGGTPKQFTRELSVEVNPAWSPDGERLAFVSSRDGRPHIWVAPVTEGAPGGPAVQWTRGDSDDFYPQWSPDGSRIAFVREVEGVPDLWIVEREGEPAARALTRGAGVHYLRWAADGRSLIVSGTWGSDWIVLHRVDAVTGESSELPRRVVLGGAKDTGDFDVSADGRFVVHEELQVRGDVWLLQAQTGHF